jgi:TIR domain-containing protein
MVHLKPLQRQGLIDAWVDTKLKAGDKWKKEIESSLSMAKVAILLVSADFLASDFIIENELPPILKGAEDKGTLIIPIMLKPCRFLREKSLNEFQAINSPDEPISALTESERELIYDTVAQRIEIEFGRFDFQ